MKKYFLLVMIVSLALLTACAAPTQNVIPTEAVDPAISKIPAYKFEVGELVILPPEVEINQPVRVNILIINVGSDTNTFIGTLYVDDQSINTKDISLNPGTSGILAFDIRITTRGMHTISLGNSRAMVSVFLVERFTISGTHLNAVPRARAVDTVYDDVAQEDSESFTPPITPFYITKVNFEGETVTDCLYSSRGPCGSYEERRISILDNNKEILYEGPAINIPNVKVNSSFDISYPAREAYSVEHLVASGPGVQDRQAFQVFMSNIADVEGMSKHY